MLFLVILEISAVYFRDTAFFSVNEDSENFLLHLLSNWSMDLVYVFVALSRKSRKFYEYKHKFSVNVFNTKPNQSRYFIVSMLLLFGFIILSSLKKCPVEWNFNGWHLQSNPSNKVFFQPTQINKSKFTLIFQLIFLIINTQRTNNSVNLNFIHFYESYMFIEKNSNRIQHLNAIEQNPSLNGIVWCVKTNKCFFSLKRSFQLRNLHELELRIYIYKSVCTKLFPEPSHSLCNRIFMWSTTKSGHCWAVVLLPVLNLVVHLSVARWH